MKKTVKVFYIASEVAPFTKTYHLADVSGAFPKALKELGHDVRVMMPNYKRINARRYVLRDVIRLKDMKIPLDDGEIQVSAKSAFLPNTKVQIYFLDNKEYFGRDGLYADPQKDIAYKDNDERFILFCQGCVETLRMLHWAPDIIHCNDWQTAFIPAYINKLREEGSFFKDTKIAFSLYNFTTEAFIRRETIDKFGISELFDPDEFEEDGSLNLLKSAVMHSDVVFIENKHTINDLSASGTIAQSIEGILREHSNKLVELGRGIDNSVWNPESDRFLKQTYDIDSISEKEQNKKALFEKLELEYSPRKPLIFMNTLPAKQQDVDKLLETIPEILALGTSFILLNKPSKANIAALNELSQRHAKHFLFREKYDEGISHLLMAGADFYLAPAWEEPMISNHLISLNYGTIPVVKSDKGFAETIKDFTKSPQNATGFVFNGSENDGIVNTLKTALELYQDADRWEMLIKNAMQEDYSWLAVGPKYLQMIAQFM